MLLSTATSSAPDASDHALAGKFFASVLGAGYALATSLGLHGRVLGLPRRLDCLIERHGLNNLSCGHLSFHLISDVAVSSW
jgi:hypothetical protein